jgi:hypothetical protein
MIRITIALLGFVVFGAIFATIYYDPDNRVKVDTDPAFIVGPGEARQTTIEPTAAGTPIAIHLRVTGSAIDVYVMEKEWSDSLAGGGRLDLSQPFSYSSELSRIGLQGVADFVILSDGLTEHLLVFDNSDSHYLNDTVPDVTGPTRGTANVEMTVRYIDVEHRSLVLGYIAAAPSIILVAFTLARKGLRWRRSRRVP